MKKIYLLVTVISMGLIISCGGEEKKEKKDKAEGEVEEEEEVIEEEAAPVDYSYVLPSIDTSALNSEAEILAAMEKVVIARKMDDSLSNSITDYEGYYSELTNLYATVLAKGTAYMSTLKSKDAILFNEKMTSITDKMYK